MKKLYTLILASFSFMNFSQTVYKDVAPIFHARCTSCHNQYSHGPSFLSYSQISSWASSIQADLNSGRMPAWKPDTNYTRFMHERTITPTEKTAILNWISNGAPAGDTTQAPPPPVYSRFQLSATPDLVLTIPTFTSNAVTQDSYVCFSLPTGLTQDRYLRAYEIVAGNPAILHHVVVNVDTAGNTSSDLSGNCYNISGNFSIGGFAPGSPPTVFPGQAPLKMGIRIKSGSKLVLQMHYPIGSAGQVDSTQIRLYFYPVGTPGIRPVYVSTPLQNWSLNIPANTIKSFSAQYNVSSPISMFAVFPHSHKICKSIKMYAYVTGDTVPLVRINDWDFQVQGYYTFKKMPKVNANYKLYSKHVYDNTTANPNNPTPQQVYAGPNTNDEMLFDGIQYLSYQPGDETMNVDSILGTDSTFAILVKEQQSSVKGGLQSYAFPNPFESTVRIGYSISSSANVSVEIYSIYGQLIRVLENGFATSGIHEVVWDSRTNSGATVPAGTYLYKVRSNGQQSTGKLNLMPR